MVKGCRSGVFRRIVRVFQEGTLAGLSDREILERFVDDRDESAFEALLARHGPMVLNVCRQVRRDPDDAEDAFQATFLALACKASALRIEESLGPWLYRVASRVAARARADRRRRGDRERSGGPIPEPASARVGGSDRDEIGRIVHEELSRLPERLREPIVLCYLEGMTHERAASQLGCPVGTIRSRLARALLHVRIARRGLATSTATLGAVLASDASAAAVPPHIPTPLVKSAVHLAAGTASLRSGCGVSARVAALLEGVLNVLRVKQLAGSMAALTVLGIVATVAGLSVFSASGQAGDVADTRRVQKRVHPISKDSGSPTPGTIVKTYYVGDLLGSLMAHQSAITQGKDDSRVQVDMAPIIDLITSTVAKGSWAIHDSQGQEIALTSEPVKHDPGAARSEAIGHITPFFQSISLIIRHTPEGHAEVAALLRKLRRLIYPPETVEEERRTAPSDTKLSPLTGQAIRPHVTPRTAPALDNSKAAGPSPPDRKARIRRLLDELRQEVEKLPKDQG